jgi:hypothetical protein
VVTRGATANDVIAILRRHYLPDGRPPGGVFAPEVESPCGRRRADLIWLPTTTGARGLVGHEVKVSRSDILAELSDPTKTDPWMRYCTQWWLVVSDPALVDGLDLPATWGVMSPPSGRRTRTMTVVRPAPGLCPLEPGRGMARLAAWMLHRHTAAEERMRRDLESGQRNARYLQQRLDDREERMVAGQHPLAPRVQQILAALSKLDWQDRPSEGDVDLIVAAIVDHVRLRHADRDLRRGIRSAADEYERNLAVLKQVTDDLARVADALPDPDGALLTA